MPILIAIHSYIYEVADYCSMHPGEGIVNNYLKNGNTNDTDGCTNECRTYCTH